MHSSQMRTTPKWKFFDSLLPIHPRRRGIVLASLVLATFAFTFFLMGIQRKPKDDNIAEVERQVFSHVHTTINKQCNSSLQFSTDVSKRLCVLIPFRNRERHLTVFAPYMHSWLKRQGHTKHSIYVIEQADDLKFNRGKLFNVGHSIAKDKCDYYALHDVDSIPTHVCNNYGYIPDAAVHLATQVSKYRYKLYYPEFFGCVALIDKNAFIRANGFSNSYWGWGCEDDDLYLRFIEADVPLIRPDDFAVGRYESMDHEQEERGLGDNRHMLKDTQQRWMTDGINSCQYKLISSKQYELYTHLKVSL